MDEDDFKKHVLSRPTVSYDFSFNPGDGIVRLTNNSDVVQNDSKANISNAWSWYADSKGKIGWISTQVGAPLFVPIFPNSSVPSDLSITIGFVHSYEVFTSVAARAVYFDPNSFSPKSAADSMKCPALWKDLCSSWDCDCQKLVDSFGINDPNQISVTGSQFKIQWNQFFCSDHNKGKGPAEGSPVDSFIRKGFKDVVLPYSIEDGDREVCEWTVHYASDQWGEYVRRFENARVSVYNSETISCIPKAPKTVILNIYSYIFGFYLPMFFDFSLLSRISQCFCTFNSASFLPQVNYCLKQTSLFKSAEIILRLTSGLIIAIMESLSFCQ